MSPAGPGIAIVLIALLSLRAHAAEKITFGDHMVPLFAKHCLNCHNQDKVAGSFDLSSYNALMDGVSGNAVVVPGDPDASTLYKVVAHTAEPKMPKDQARLADKEIELLRAWIAGGLLETDQSKAKIANRPKVDLALGEVAFGRPDVPPMPGSDQLIEPVVHTKRTGAIFAMAANPWAPLVAIGAQKQILLYNTDTYELAGILPFRTGFAYDLKFSGNGKLLIAGGGRPGAHGHAVVYDITTGRKVFDVGNEPRAVLGADISSDQSQIAIGSPTKLVKVYSTIDGELLYALKKHTDWVTTVAYSPDAVLLATGDRAGGLVVWETFTGRIFYTLGGHDGAVTSLTWRDDSNILASAGNDGQVRMWRMADGNQVRNWQAHDGGVTSIDFDHQGRIVSAGRDRTAKLWKPDGGGIHTFEAFDELALQVAITHKDGKVIAGDWTGAVRIWNAGDAKRLAELSSNPPTIAMRVEEAQAQVDAIEPTYNQRVAEYEAVKVDARRFNRQLVSLDAIFADASSTLTNTSAQFTAAREAKADADAKMKVHRDAIAELIRVAAEARKTVDDLNAAIDKSRDDRAALIKALPARHALAKQLRESAAAAQAVAQMPPEDESLDEAAKHAAAAADNAEASVTHMTRTIESLAARTVELTEQHGSALVVMKQADADAVAKQKQVDQHMAVVSEVSRHLDVVMVDRTKARAKAEAAGEILKAKQVEAEPALIKAAKAKKALDEAASQFDAATSRVNQLNAGLVYARLYESLDALDVTQREVDEAQLAQLQTEQMKAQVDDQLMTAREEYRQSKQAAKTTGEALAKAHEVCNVAASARDAAKTTVASMQEAVGQANTAVEQAQNTANGMSDDEAAAQTLAVAQQALESHNKSLSDAQAVVSEQQELVKTAEAARDEAIKSRDTAKVAVDALASKVKKLRAKSRKAQTNVKSLRNARTVAANTLAKQQAIVEALTAEYEKAKRGGAESDDSSGPIDHQSADSI